MQQTFYIDSDEEISSVIERLRKSLANENFFVLPKRALVMQSVVNLKLLKREADKMKKRVTIVTQDELSANMATRAEIPVRATIERPDDFAQVGSDQIPESGKYPNSELQADPGNLAAFSQKKDRLKVVGTDDFYDDKKVGAGLQQGKKHPEKMKRPNGIIASTQAQTRQTVNTDMVAGKPVRYPARNAGNDLDPRKAQTLEKMFQKTQAAEPQQQIEVPIKGMVKKIIVGFILICFFSFSALAAYLFVPKANISVVLFAQKKKIDLDVTGESSQSRVDSAAKRIPLRVIKETSETSLSFEATGESDALGTKAHGTVAVYNEFSAQPQPLVSSTRLESAEGKIFRLLKDVTVPGMTQVAGELKPGVIEVEVVADEPGSAFNLEATTFTIPGFKGGPKFDKFTAKSTRAMLGGDSSGTVAKVVTQRDVENAKKATEARLKEKIREVLTVRLAPGEILVDGAIYESVSESVADAKVGSTQESFGYRAKSEISAAVFSKQDAEELLVEAYRQESLEKNDIENVRIDYAGVTPDFDKGTLTMKLHGEVSLKADLDEARLKNDFLGKNEEGVRQIVAKYPQIKNITFEFEPKFVSRVPQYAQRVILEVKTEN